jgi:hypothetical protein
MQSLLAILFGLLAVGPATGEECRTTAVGYRVMQIGDRTATCLATKENAQLINDCGIAFFDNTSSTGQRQFWR